MKKTFWTGAVLLLALITVYTAWPYKGLYDLSRALQSRNAAALAENLYMPALRQSLSIQVLQGYAKLTGGTGRLGPFESVALRAAANMADPLIDQIINPENLLDLLDKGWPSTVALSAQSSELGGVALPRVANVWEIYLNSEYRGRDYYVSLPVSVQPHQRFRLNFRLIAGRWKLAGIDLPEEVRMTLARELLRHNKT